MSLRTCRDREHRSHGRRDRLPQGAGSALPVDGRDPPWVALSPPSHDKARSSGPASRGRRDRLRQLAGSAPPVGGRDPPWVAFSPPPSGEARSSDPAPSRPRCTSLGACRDREDLRRAVHVTGYANAQDPRCPLRARPTLGRALTAAKRCGQPSRPTLPRLRCMSLRPWRDRKDLRRAVDVTSCHRRRIRADR
jgi:hypothetical protein